jgi:thioredoxin reductase
VDKITGEGILIRSDGQSTLIKADSVVLSPAPKPDNQLAEGLKDRIPELYVIGDAAGGHRILDAIHGGYEVACKI